MGVAKAGAEVFSLTRIDTVIFDLGDVLIAWDPRNLYRKLIPDQEVMEDFLANVCTPAWNVRQDAGRSLEEGTAELLAAFPQHEAWIRAFYERWPEMLGGVIEGTAELLGQLRAGGCRVLALTNWSAETFPLAQRLFPVLGEFEGIVVSGQEGTIKPDPAIYRLLCTRYRVSPDRAVFIDDNPRNVEAARAIGMHGIRFTAPPQLGDELRSLGLVS